MEDVNAQQEDDQSQAEELLRELQRGNVEQGACLLLVRLTGQQSSEMQEQQYAIAPGSPDMLRDSKAVEVSGQDEFDDLLSSLGF